MINKLLSIIKYILPFSNEIGNILTASHTDEFKRLYKFCPTDWYELELKNMIDILALSGIVWNVSYVSNKYGSLKGIIYGWMLIVVAFITPNLTMEYVINKICNEGVTFDELYKEHKNKEHKNKDNSTKCSHLYRFLVGFSYIFILFITEILLSLIIKGKFMRKISPSINYIFN